MFDLDLEPHRYFDVSRLRVRFDGQSSENNFHERIKELRVSRGISITQHHVDYFVSYVDLIMLQYIDILIVKKCKIESVSGWELTPPTLFDLILKSY